jgi:hypothetical protein
VVRPTVPSAEQRELRRYTERPPLLASGSAMSQLGSRQFLRWRAKSDGDAGLSKVNWQLRSAQGMMSVSYRKKQVDGDKADTCLDKTD